MCAVRTFAVIAWKRLGFRCANCHAVIPRGALMIATAHDDVYCDRTCEALHTLNTEPLAVAQ